MPNIKHGAQHLVGIQKMMDGWMEGWIVASLFKLRYFLFFSIYIYLNLVIKLQIQHFNKQVDPSLPAYKEKHWIFRNKE